MLPWGFIQAGGRSSRMNPHSQIDKAWLEIDGVPMIARVAAAATPVVERLGIIVNAANPQLERYRALAESRDAKLVFDLHEHRGPLGGIHTALAHCDAGDAALILACDLPFVTTEFLSFISEVHQQSNPPSVSQTIDHIPQLVTVPLDMFNRPQPLAAIYDQSLETKVSQMIALNELRVDRLYSYVPTRRINFAELARLPGAERFFINVNTFDDWRNVSGVDGQ